MEFSYRGTTSTVEVRRYASKSQIKNKHWVCMWSREFMITQTVYPVNKSCIKPVYLMQSADFAMNSNIYA